MNLAENHASISYIWGYIRLKHESELDKEIDQTMSIGLSEKDYESINTDNNCGIYISKKSKFEKERVLFQNDRYAFAMDGLILNKKELANEIGKIHLDEICEEMLMTKGVDFIKILRGNFFGVIYDRHAKKAILFTDQLGTKWLFYNYDPLCGLLKFSNKIEIVTKLIRNNGGSVKLDVMGAYSMLALGYMCDELTLVDNIKKVRAGTLLEISEKATREYTYYYIDNTEFKKDSRNDIIEELDERFKNVIIQEYEIDNEYGYDHLATLSGGIDSRMTVGVAFNCGYRNITTFTMSQSNYYDDTISRDMAMDMGLKHIFISLNNGDYLEDIEKGSFYQEGLVMYSGSAHLRYALEGMNMDDYGIIHTGMVGDGVFGTFLIAPQLFKLDEEKIVINSKSKEFVDYWRQIYMTYQNSELYKFYVKAVNGVFNGYRTIEGFSEYASPFLHVDFLDYAFRIPPILRYKKRIYKEWIKKKHGNLTRYPLESNLGMGFDTPEMYVFARRALRKVRKTLIGPSWNDAMVPMQHWYACNDKMRECLNRYFAEHIESLSGYPELMEEAKRVFSSQNVETKTKALTLLYAVILLNLK